MTVRVYTGEFRVVKYCENNYSAYVSNRLDNTLSHLSFLTKEDLWALRGEINKALDLKEDVNHDNRTDEKQALRVEPELECG